LQRNAHLRSCHANTRRIVHHITHPIHQGHQLNVVHLAIEGGGNLTQDGVPRLDYDGEFFRIKESSDSIPDLHRIKVSGGAGYLVMALMRHVLSLARLRPGTVG
jgi:hypothetical protein